LNIIQKYIFVKINFYELFGSTPNFETVLGELLIKFHLIASVKTGLAKVVFRIFYSG